MDFLMVYVTCENLEEARKIASHLLEKRLAACANILPVRSMYWWKGKIEDDEEAALILKTRKEHKESIVKEVLKLHSYDVPCVEFFKIKDGNPTYMEWIEKETSGESL